MKMKKSIAAAALGLMSVVTAHANSLTFQGVTFNTWAIDSDTLGLSILNATHATGNWSGVNFLNAFEIKNVGNVASASITSGPGSFASNVNNGISNAAGCTSGGTPGACFFSLPPVALTDSMTWSIDFAAASGSAINFQLPHLKVQFLVNANDTRAKGDLLSRDIPVSAVPEPETYAMMLAGLGLIGTIVRRRKIRSA